MPARTSCNDLAVTVSVIGEIDMMTAPDVRAAVDDALSRLASRSLVIDLTEATFFGTRGVHVIEDAVEELARRGVREPVRVVTDRRAHLRLLEVAGLLHLAQVKAAVSNRQAVDRLAERQISATARWGRGA